MKYQLTKKYMFYKTRFFIVLYLLLSLQKLYTFTDAYFSPDDHPTEKLIALINQTKIRIHAAIYSLTDGNIAAALAEAKKIRNVDVQVVVDRSTIDSEYGKTDILRINNIDVHVFVPPGHSTNKNHYSALMHNKFAILDNILWTGSFNWTKSANTKNQENVLVTTDATVCEKYEKQFEILKTRCTPYLPPTRRPQLQEESSGGFTSFTKKILQDIWSFIINLFD
jgi:phosphatidylserine/phosphatidylglycerophosphate/cardiolipin synthase-like enzyme